MKRRKKGKRRKKISSRENHNDLGFLLDSYLIRVVVWTLRARGSRGRISSSRIIRERLLIGSGFVFFFWVDFLVRYTARHNWFQLSIRFALNHLAWQRGDDASFLILHSMFNRYQFFCSIMEFWLNLKDATFVHVSGQLFDAGDQPFKNIQKFWEMDIMSFLWMALEETKFHLRELIKKLFPDSH